MLPVGGSVFASGRRLDTKNLDTSNVYVYCRKLPIHEYSKSTAVVQFSAADCSKKLLFRTMSLEMSLLRNFSTALHFLSEK